MTEIIPGIHQFKIPIPDNPLGYTNTYLVQGGDENLLIDPGIDSEVAFDSLKKELSEIGVGVVDIVQVIATHSHGDHYGLAGRIKQLSQARVIMHRLARDQIQSMSANMKERRQQIEQWLNLNGMPHLDLSEMQWAPPGLPTSITPVTPDAVLQGGEIISVGNFNFKVIWTPGHDPGHICLYEPNQKILFSGDHVLPVITPNVSLQTQPGVNPLSDFFNSLNIVKQLDVRLVLPAHESPFTELKRRVEEILAHHERRNSEVLTALMVEPRTAYHISTEITWMPDLGGVKFENLAPWDKRMAVMETLAHLEAMKIDGRVDKSLRDSIVYYQLS